MKAWGILVAAVVVALLPASAAGKPGYHVVRPEQRAELGLRGSNGFRLELVTLPAWGHDPAQVYVSARKGAASVTYRVPGSLRADDKIDVRLPHVGRIAVGFDPAKVKPGFQAPNCRGRRAVIETGTFRGTIQIRGEEGFTAVERGSAPGRVTRSFRQVCGSSASFGNGPKPRVSFTSLIAGDQNAQDGLHFGLYEAKFGPTISGAHFLASSTRHVEGMEVVSAVSAEDHTDPLELSKPGSPKIVDVTPPRPFRGTATFELASPTTPTWEGDLSVELPGVGAVSLAGPDFWSGLCTDGLCTDTVPPSVHFSFAAIVVASGP